MLKSHHSRVKNSNTIKKNNQNHIDQIIIHARQIQYVYQTNIEVPKAAHTEIFKSPKFNYIHH